MNKNTVRQHIRWRSLSIPSLREAPPTERHANGKSSRRLKVALRGMITLAIAMLVYLYWPRALPPQPSSFQLISHRGVHQTFPLDNLENDTCTAKIIDRPTHNLLENTIDSISAAFKFGADIVEIDIHPTTDNQVAVFHDWTIDCRTNGKGITHEQSMTSLKKLDIGHGYTADGGKTYPLRGKAIGLMPTLTEVLQAFPDRKLAINQKDKFTKTVQLVVKTLKEQPRSQHQNIYFFSGAEQFKLLKTEVPEVQRIIPSRNEIKGCSLNYLGMLFSGKLAASCNENAFAVPVRYLKYIPGWPSLFLSQARRANLKVYVADVDTPEDLAQVKGLPIDGIVTNRIEIISKHLLIISKTR
jgi:glycerophosphoryl diester phosphodiesterase